METVRTLRHHIALHWPPDDLERLARALRPYSTGLADTYREYAESRRGRVKKWSRKLTQRRSPDAPRPEEG
ncbi:hypothetical protein SMD44_07839 [Streptomyces alboflavus]|uniref:Transposase n=1 Tax=Streptomyces alboflavus TaxID=67267 RepID=A0A1Z1WPV2_9ACTN|nr:hypothetical protein [Streptomyces alboflavus]ARX88352.1 hypothetical protein SMD44_07839 [Streptomyces alboflavus]